MLESPQWLGALRVSISATLLCTVLWWTDNMGDCLSWHSGQFRGQYYMLGDWLPLASPSPLASWLFRCALKSSAALMCLGLFYRFASLLFFLLFAYTFALDASRYSHSLYLQLLCAGFLAAMPANRCFALDSFVFQRQCSAMDIDRWYRRTVRVLVAIVYFYSAMSKLGIDFLAYGQPLVANKDAIALFMPFGTDAVAVQAIQWSCRALVLAEFVIAAGMAFMDDGGPSSVLVFALSFAVQLFCHAIAPSMMQPLIVALSTSCMSADWLWPSATTKQQTTPTTMTVRRQSNRRRQHRRNSNRQYDGDNRLLAYVCITFICIQAVLPLHRFAYDGDTALHEYGRHFSWHSDLTYVKQCSMSVLVRDDSLPEHHNSFAPRWLNATNPGHWERVARNPTLLNQYALYLARQWRDAPPDMVTHDSVHTWPTVEIYSNCSINGGKVRPLVQFGTDMAVYNQSGASFQWPHSWLFRV